MNGQHAQVTSRRLLSRRVLIGLSIVLVVGLISGIATYGYIDWRFGQVKKLNLSAVLSNPADNGSPSAMTVLLVGSDSRAALASGEQSQFGTSSQVAGQRSDTMMLLHVDPATGRAAIISLPRDLWVPIAGTNTKNRINSAFDNGPQQLIQTIRQDFDMPVDHYAEVNFDGFRSIVNAIGGVQIPFSAPARDWGFDDATHTTHNLSGLDIRQTGCINLSGDQALSYVRTRHYQAFEGGQWRSDPQSDLSRIDRQQDFIRRVMRKSISKGLNNPLTLNDLVSAGVKNLTIDSGFSLKDITGLARRFHSLDPSKVEMMTLPTSPVVINGADVLQMKEPDAGNTIQRFLNGAPAASATQATSVPVGAISVKVLNGSGTAGQATDVSGQLKGVGFGVAGLGDTPHIATTTIRYATGEKAKADVLASYVQGATREIQDSTIRGFDVVLMTGDSFQSISSTPAPTTTTSTAVPPVTKAAPTTSTTVSPFVPSPSLSC